MRKLYEEIITDVAMEISLESKWRKKIFSLKKGQYLEISCNSCLELPIYIRNDVLLNNLVFCVEVVDDCPETFDEGMVIFKFYSKDYPEVCSYSGNNPEVV